MREPGVLARGRAGALVDVLLAVQQEMDGLAGRFPTLPETGRVELTDERAVRLIARLEEADAGDAHVAFDEWRAHRVRFDRAVEAVGVARAAPRPSGVDARMRFDQALVRSLRELHESRAALERASQHVRAVVVRELER